jgi:integrase
MARKVKDSNLDSPDARRKLKPRDQLYVRSIDRGLHLGYRRPKTMPGTWWARHYLGNGKYEPELLGIANDASDADGLKILDFWQAQTKAREGMAQRVRDAFGATGPLTVNQALDLYFESKEGEGRDTTDARCRADLHIVPAIGERECASLTTADFREWLQKLARQAPRVRAKDGQAHKFRNTEGDKKELARRRQASANRVWTILRAALNHAFNDGKIPTDAAWRKAKPFKGVNTARLRYLSMDETRRLVNACDPYFQPLVQAALQTGARYGQLAQLTVSDFNPDAGTLRLRSRKGDGTEKVYHATLTEEGSNFFAHICAGRRGDELIFRNAGRFERAIEGEKERRQKAGKSIDKIAIDDSDEWRKSEQKRLMDEAVKRAKIKPAIAFHGLRHTWASHAVMNGVPLLVVAKNLGHSDTRMVEKHYGHLADSYVTKAIRADAPKYGFKIDSKVMALPSRGR